MVSTILATATISTAASARLHSYFTSGFVRTWRRLTTLSFETDGKRLPPLMDAKKGKTRKGSTPIKVWVTPEEKAARKGYRASLRARCLMCVYSRAGENPDTQTLSMEGEALKKGGIFAATILTVLTTLGLLSLAGSNRAVGADNQKAALKTGAQLWQENCTMCHEDRPRTSYSPAQSDAARRHMQGGCGLTVMLPF